MTSKMLWLAFIALATPAIASEPSGSAMPSLDLPSASTETPQDMPSGSSVPAMPEGTPADTTVPASDPALPAGEKETEKTGGQSSESAMSTMEDANNKKEVEDKKESEDKKEGKDKKTKKSGKKKKSARKSRSRGKAKECAADVTKIEEQQTNYVKQKEGASQPTSEAASGQMHNDTTAAVQDGSCATTEGCSQ